MPTYKATAARNLNVVSNFFDGFLVDSLALRLPHVLADHV
jgi:hypothetical protein